MDLYQDKFLIIFAKVDFDMISHYLVSKKIKVDKTCQFKYMMDVQGVSCMSISNQYTHNEYFAEAMGDFICAIKLKLS